MKPYGTQNQKPDEVEIYTPKALLVFIIILVISATVALALCIMAIITGRPL